jgi:hypothetical protein
MAELLVRERPPAPPGERIEVYDDNGRTREVRERVYAQLSGAGEWRGSRFGHRPATARV